MKLKTDFYLRPDVVSIARELIGKTLITNIDGKFCEAMITETEAYAGVTDKASHAYGGRCTPRTSIMYLKGGHAYVYLCYGLYHLFNVVTHEKGIPHAVLIRAAQPLEGNDTMLSRRGFSKIKPALTSGPGALAKAMGIHTCYSGISLLGKTIWLRDAGIHIPENQITSTPRIGVEYAQDDALLPYRFYLKNNIWVSKVR